MVRLLNSFTLICKEYNPHNKFVWDTSACVCDFRINIHGCPEQEVYAIANWVLIPYCLLLSIVASICLYRLIYVKKQPFFLPARKDRGILRPRPQHTCYALALIYCPWKIIYILQLINDLYPSVAWAEVFQILPQILIASFSVLYPLSILYSTGAIEINASIESRNLLKIDIICISIMLSPLVIFLPLAGLTGYYADAGNIEKANKYFITQNIFWVIWGSFYVGSMMYFCSKFIPRVLKNIEELTLDNDNKGNLELKSKLDQFLQNRDDITIPTIRQIIPACFYLLILFLYTVSHRSNVIFVHWINVIYLIVWQYGIPIAIHIIQWVMIYNTHVAKIPSDAHKTRGGGDERSLAYHAHTTLSPKGIGFGEANSNNDNSNNDSSLITPKRTHRSIYSIDIKSKKSEWINNMEGSGQRHSTNFVSSNNGYRYSSSATASNVKLVNKTHKSSYSVY